MWRSRPGTAAELHSHRSNAQPVGCQGAWNQSGKLSAMKVMIALLAMFAAAPVSPDYYPMHVQVVKVTSRGRQTIGYGNLSPVDSPIVITAFDFDGTCGREAFLTTDQAGVEYRGHMDKSEPTTLIMLYAAPGSNKLTLNCKLSVQLHPQVLYTLDANENLIKVPSEDATRK